MVTADCIDKVAELVKAQGLSEAVVAELRDSFRGCHFTYCMDDDIGGGLPYRECRGFNIYLVNSDDHCSVLTRDLDAASGMVLAELVEE